MEFGAESTIRTQDVGGTGIELPPLASVLMESLRAVGYSAPAAIADLIDNTGQRSMRIAGRYPAAIEAAAKRAERAPGEGQ